MPNCFQLFPKSDPKNAVVLAKLDDEICVHFGVTPHPTQYYCAWFDIIGFDLAAGKSFDELKKRYHEYVAEKEHPEDKAFWQRQIEIADYIDANYTPNAWYQVGK